MEPTVNHKTLPLIVAILLSLAVVASATLLLVDDFSYNSGNLITVGDNWEIHDYGCCGSFAPYVSSNELEINASGCIDVSHDLKGGDPITEDVIYAGFDLKVQNPPADGYPVMVAGFLNFTDTDYFGAVWAQYVSSSQYNLGISLAGATVQYAAGSLATDDWVRVVVRLDRQQPEAALWINGASETETPDQTESTGTLKDIDRFAILQEDWSIYGYIDDLIVADTFSAANMQPGIRATVDGTVIADGGTINFADVKLDEGATTTTVTLENIGYGDLSLTNLALAYGAGFSLGAFSDSSLAHGEQATFTITFDPSDGGEVTGTITFNTTDPNYATFTITINGKGLSVDEDCCGSSVTDQTSHLWWLLSLLLVIPIVRLVVQRR